MKKFTILILALVLTCCMCLLAAEPVSQPATASAPAKVTVDQSSPKALLLTMYLASVAKDYDSLLQCASPEMRPIVAVWVEMKRVSAPVIALAKEKLGDLAPTPNDISSGPSLGCPIVAQVAKGNEVDWSKVAITEDGDQAEVRIRDDRIKLKKIEGKWFSGDEMDADTRPIVLAKAHKDLAKLKTLCQGLESGLKDGSITGSNVYEKLESLRKATATTTTSQATPR